MSRMTEQQRDNEYLSTWYTTAYTADNLRRHVICAIDIDLAEVFEAPPLHKSSMTFPENSSSRLGARNYHGNGRRIETRECNPYELYSCRRALGKKATEQYLKP